MASIEFLGRSAGAITEDKPTATNAILQGLPNGGVATPIVSGAAGIETVLSPSTTMWLGFGAGPIIVGADYASVGVTVSSAGDFNHDGVEDFMFTGAVTYLIYGHAGGLGAIDLYHLTADQGFAINAPSGAEVADMDVARAGDVNGDGLDDIIIGLPRSNSVYVLYGHAGVSGTVNLGAITTAQGAAISMNPPAPGGNLGMFLGGSVAGAGDVNGDGVDDVIIGAGEDASGGTYGGRAFVIYGSTNGLGNINLATLTLQQGFALQGTQGGLAGLAVTGLGDINGDGIDDLAVSAPYNNTVYVYYGKAGGLSSTTLGPIAASDGFIIQGAQYAGYTLAAAGDVNGDGYQDIVIGTGRYLPGTASYVVYGKPGGIGTVDLAHLAASQGFTIHATGVNGDYIGGSVAGAGDVNGDGFDDVVIGVVNYGATGSGYVVFGSAAGGDVTLGGNDTLQITGGSTNDGLGMTVAEADVNGDGYSDLVLGAPRTNYAGYARGATYVVYGQEATSPVNLTGTVAGQTLAGGSGDDILNGVGGDDRLYGNAGHDVLNGGTGNDYLNGGSGADDLTGGTGNDSYVVDSAADVIHELANEGIDTLIATVSASLGDYANIENLTLGGTADLTATGDGGDNVITGNEGNNHLIGLGGSDTLIGNGGADTLDGGAGADLMVGGAGDDIYHVDDSLDVVVEKAGEGIDTVIAAIDHYILGDQIENLTLAGAIVEGTGNALANVITGNDTGNHLLGLDGADTLIGNGGADILDGGAGADSMTGGTGDDTYYVDNRLDTITEAVGEGDDLVIASLDYMLVANVERLTLADGALNGTGNTLANTIMGNDGDNHLTGLDGNDTLIGNGGTDTLDGGLGADSMSGGTGNDTYIVDNVGDTVSEAAGAGTDIVFSSIDWVLSANVENLALTGSALIGTGNADNNVIFGTSGANILNGAQGADSLFGVAGDDTYYVDNAFDTVNETAGEGDDLIIASVDYILGANVERLTLADGALNGTGNTLANTITGNDGENHLLGLDGDDVLIGNGGADMLDGGLGADSMSGGTGDDIYIVDNAGDTVSEVAGAGIDTVLSSINLVLSANVENLTLKGNALNGTGNADANVIVGTSGANILDGGQGADMLFGGAGNDTYYADRADDLVFENAAGGTDTVIASAGYYLYANIENLTLAAGAGDIFGVGNELSNIITGNEGSNLLIAGAGDDTAHGGAGLDSLFGQDGDDHLFGDAGVDYLVGGNGDDVLDGGAAADALYGEDGNDTLYGGTDFATDILVGGNGNDVLHGDSGLGDYDLMDGGAGDDSYYVDTPADLTFEAVGGGTDTVYANISGAGYYLYANVENLVLLGTTPYGVGNELDNHMTGNASANYLLGGAGNDALNGKGGNDVLFGESGADTFIFEHGTGGDVIGDFLAGTDKIDLSAFGFANYQTVVNSMHEVNGTTAIDLGGGDFIVLNGVTEASLNAGDFILGGSASANVFAVGSLAHTSSSIGSHLASMPALVHPGDVFI
jgi:Ca2+-binding RTX toxin-like protein